MARRFRRISPPRKHPTPSPPANIDWRDEIHAIADSTPHQFLPSQWIERGYSWQDALLERERRLNRAIDGLLGILSGPYQTFEEWLQDDDDDTLHGAPRRNRKPIPAAIRQLVFERDEYRCVECGSTENLTLDHIIPWSAGGSDDESNLRTLCRSCNSRRGARV